MTPNQLFFRAQVEFDSKVKLIKPGQWEDPTPDSEWSVRDLVSHLVNENLWVPDLLSGRTIADVGDKYDGDILGADPLMAWSQSATRSREATQQVPLEKIVHLSFGDVPASEYLNQLFSDHLIHAWDLAKALDVDFNPSEDLVEACFDYLAPQAESWRQAGSFGPAVGTPDEAEVLTRLLGLTGRKA